MKNIRSCVLLALAGLLAGGSALAVELKVLSAGAIKPVVLAALPDFERLTGHKVVVENATEAAAVQQLLAALAAPQVRAQLATLGMEAP